MLQIYTFNRGAPGHRCCKAGSHKTHQTPQTTESGGGFTVGRGKPNRLGGEVERVRERRRA